MKKIMSCLLSFSPLITLVVSMVLLFGTSIVGGIIGEQTVPWWLMIFMILATILAFAAVILTFVVMIMYIIKTCKNTELSAEKKVIWCIVLYFLNVFAYPVFWFMYESKKIK